MAFEMANRNGSHQKRAGCGIFARVCGLICSDENCVWVGDGGVMTRVCVVVMVVCGGDGDWEEGVRMGVDKELIQKRGEGRKGLWRSRGN